MDENQIRHIFRQMMQEDKMNSQYNVNRAPVHDHNGMNSPRLDFGGSLVNRQLLLSSHVVSTEAATAGNYGHFYIHELGMPPATVITISEVHGRAGNDAGSVVLALRSLVSGDDSLTGGTTVTTFNLKGTANAPTYKTLQQGKPPAVLYPGYRLALQTSGTLTNVADVVVTVLLQY